ncbi:nucleotide exchange factor GrpE [Spirulina sp. CS-785/01]|uniref:nucleotide exchange factor GrpE n=1 Tax=Spirulina sp. CS-785/01 TaxID=3021716 RepID=UPI00232D44E1|nr:nucleotide exchange factor GrpE [Spirulina sp. CS-785/01]MDB9314443.1 nucleotide exchange factor GrpE [Spirulina sp. CS-785/01]
MVSEQGNPETNPTQEQSEEQVSLSDLEFNDTEDNTSEGNTSEGNTSEGNTSEGNTSEGNNAPSGGGDGQAGSPAQTPDDNAKATQELVESLQKELEQLKQKLAKQTEQTEGYKAQFARNAADFDNFRKRTQKDKEEQAHLVKRETLSELLPVVDNFERARSQIKPATEGEMAIHKSYQGVYKNLVDGLKRLGVAAMRPEGQPFDPTYHEAMLREPTHEHPEDTVIEQLVRGYLLNDRVLRHAMVKVAAPPEDAPSDAPSTEEESDTEENSPA